MHLDNYDDFGKSLDQWRNHFKGKKCHFERSEKSYRHPGNSLPVISTEGRNLHASSRQPRFKISPALRPFEMTKL